MQRHAVAYKASKDELESLEAKQQEQEAKLLGWKGIHKF